MPTVRTRAGELAYDRLFTRRHPRAAGAQRRHEPGRRLGLDPNRAGGRQYRTVAVGQPAHGESPRPGPTGRPSSVPASPTSSRTSSTGWAIGPTACLAFPRGRVSRRRLAIRRPTASSRWCWSTTASRATTLSGCAVLRAMCLPPLCRGLLYSGFRIGRFVSRTPVTYPSPATRSAFPGPLVPSWPPSPPADRSLTTEPRDRADAYGASHPTRTLPWTRGARAGHRRRSSTAGSHRRGGAAAVSPRATPSTCTSTSRTAYLESLQPNGSRPAARRGSSRATGGLAPGSEHPSALSPWPTWTASLPYAFSIAMPRLVRVADLPIALASCVRDPTGLSPRFLPYPSSLSSRSAPAERVSVLFSFLLASRFCAARSVPVAVPPGPPRLAQRLCVLAGYTPRVTDGPSPSRGRPHYPLRAGPGSAARQPGLRPCPLLFHAIPSLILGSCRLSGHACSWPAMALKLPLFSMTAL